MTRHNVHERLFFELADRLVKMRRQPEPAPQALRACRIVAHRGEHDNRHVLENTMEAFKRAADAGVWGLEFDLRWTKDLVPVVFHDADMLRLFGRPVRVRDLRFRRLRTEFPLVPTLDEVRTHFGGRCHLMVEVKAGTFRDPVRQAEILAGHFTSLTPAVDFHFISLDPREFGAVGFVPPSALLPIARTNVRRLEALCLKKNYGGLNGHYLLMGRALLRRLHAAGMAAGTGFAGSRNCLFREINRGVDWIFSDAAATLQRICNMAGTT